MVILPLETLSSHPHCKRLSPFSFRAPSSQLLSSSLCSKREVRIGRESYIISPNFPLAMELMVHFRDGEMENRLLPSQSGSHTLPQARHVLMWMSRVLLKVGSRGSWEGTSPQGLVGKNDHLRGRSWSNRMSIWSFPEVVSHSRLCYSLSPDVTCVSSLYSRAGCLLHKQIWLRG